MAYCSIDDLLKVIEERLLIELTDDEGTGTYDAGKIQRAIEAAENEINGYCQERYASKLPFDPVPGLIRDLCVNIAIYNLMLRRGHVSEEWQQRYKRSVEMLRDIADGRISLGDSEVEEDTVIHTAKGPDDRVFKDLTGY